MKTYSCDTCNKAFCTNIGLTVHKRHHIDEKPFKCERCYMTFSKLDAMNRHKTIHTGEMLYACDLCEKNILTSKPFECTQNVSHGREAIPL